MQIIMLTREEHFLDCMQQLTKTQLQTKVNFLFYKFGFASKVS